MKKLLTFSICTLGLGLALVYNGCGKVAAPSGADSSNMINNINGETLQSTGGGNPVTNDPNANLKVMFGEYKPRGIKKLVFCLSQISFKHLKMPKGMPADKDVNIKLGDTEILPEGTDLFDVDLLDGTYEKISITLDAKKCASKKTVQITRGSEYGYWRENENKYFSTNETIKLSFSGLFSAQNVKMELQFRLDEIARNLNQVRDSGEIKPAIESALGSF